MIAGELTRDDHRRDGPHPLQQEASPEDGSLELTLQRRAAARKTQAISF